MINFEKEYIIQCLTSAANNLRLSSEKIEIIALVKEYLGKSSAIGESINELKRTTAFSKLAIQLGLVLNSLQKSGIDFLRLSEKFREDTLMIIPETGRMLENTNPGDVARLFEDLAQKEREVEPGNDSQMKYDEAEDIPVVQTVPKGDTPSKPIEDAEEVKIDDFVSGVLRPITEVESVLTRIEIDDYAEDELTYYSEIMFSNAEKSEELGFDVISKMQYIFADGLQLFRDGKLQNPKRVVELLRACLIVVVAIVRKKNVDLTDYIQQAEIFGSEIKEIIRKGI